jgi:hypothetical protein
MAARKKRRNTDQIQHFVVDEANITLEQRHRANVTGRINVAMFFQIGSSRPMWDTANNAVAG